MTTPTIIVISRSTSIAGEFHVLSEVQTEERYDRTRTGADWLFKPALAY